MQDEKKGAQQRLRAGCKINVFLRITGVRMDGYHNLDTLFLPVSEPYDELIIQHDTTSSSSGAHSALTVHCSTPGIDTAHNTLSKAYNHFASATGWRPKLNIELIKGIPHGAGLGGGSSDAAVLLLYLQEHCPKPLDDTRLRQTALQVGADVPFFLENVPRRASSAGEKFAPCPAEWNVLRDLFLVLVCPPVHVPTEWAFAEWDKAHVALVPQKNTEAQKKQIFLPDVGAESLTDNAKPAKNHRSRFVELFSVDAGALLVAENNFEPVVFARHAELGRIKACLYQKGAAAACMSGSGAALFGLFRQKATAKAAVELLRKQGLSTFGPCHAMK